MVERCGRMAVLTLAHLPVVEGDLVGELEQSHEISGPWTGGEGDGFTRDVPRGCLDHAYGARFELEPEHLHALDDLNAGGPGHALECGEGRRRIGPAAARLVQERGRPLSLPVGEDGLHVCADGLCAADESRRVPDVPVLRGNPLQLVRLRLRHDGDVADLAKPEETGIEFEDLDRSPDDLVHRRREVEVSNDPARDPAGSGSDALLVEDDDPGARAPELRQVESRREPVHASTDDDDGR